jgi:hypothetical protein
MGARFWQSAAPLQLEDLTKEADPEAKGRVQYEEFIKVWFARMTPCMLLARTKSRMGKPPQACTWVCICTLQMMMAK